MRPSSPCLLCADRYPDCQDSCKFFRAYKKLDEEFKQQVVEGRKKYSWMNGKVLWSEGKRRAERAKKK